MIKKSWRSRFVARLVADVSRSAQQRAAARPRLFPYGIADTIADPFHRPVHLRLLPPAAPEPATPAAPRKVWHFVKR